MKNRYFSPDITGSLRADGWTTGVLTMKYSILAPPRAQMGHSNSLSRQLAALKHA